MMYSSFLCALFATLGFCILFHVPKRCIIPASVVGSLGWLFYLIALDTGTTATVATFAGACAVAVTGDICSRLFKEAATIFVIPGILPLVPGAGIYYTMFYFIQGNMEKSADWGTQTLMIAGAIALGLLVIASFIRIIVNTGRNIRKWRNKNRYEDFE